MKKLRPIEILLVEDNPGDVRLTREAFKENKLKCQLNVVPDGIEALAYLRKESPYESANSPDLILLDLNLPRRNGHEVLEIVKSDSRLRIIPIVIFTTSDAEKDVIKAYDLHANCFLTKPVDLTLFLTAMQKILEFWCMTAELPVERDL